jgi:hypothetical protein
MMKGWLKHGAERLAFLGLWDLSIIGFYGQNLMMSGTEQAAKSDS